jgi:membrane associated rhomboid family serine protease
VSMIAHSAASVHASNLGLYIAAIGVIAGFIGALLLYFFRDPKGGSGLMLESYNPKREAWGARFGIGLVALGALMQVVAIIVTATN